METGTHKESSVIYLHCTPTLCSYREIQTLDSRHKTQDYTKERMRERLQQSTDGLGKYNSPFYL